MVTVNTTDCGGAAAIERVLECENLIDRLKNSGKPVLLYGMGNGAELMLDYLTRNSVKISGVFASDGFVRGQQFLGRRVLSVAEAEEKYGDFAAVLCFALEGEKTAVAYDFARRHLLVCPSICPYGGELDAHFVKKYKNQLCRLWDSLADDNSRKSLFRLLCFAVTGDGEYVRSPVFTVPDGYISHSGRHVDIGAYRGGTVLEYLEMNPRCAAVTAFEPDPHSYEALCAAASSRNVDCVNAAVSGKSGTSSFAAKGSRASSLGQGDGEVKTLALDDYFGCRYAGDKSDVASIRIDGEGAEEAIIGGGANLLYSSRPAVCAAVYHRSRDIFEIPRLLSYHLGDCRLYLQLKPYLPAFDVFIYAVPN